MSAFDLDRLCEWVYAKRSVGNDILLQCNEQCIKQAVEVVSEEEGDVIIKYKPVCSDWHANYWGWSTLLHGNHTTHLFQPLLVPVSKCPSATARIKPDGNCFFRSIALAVTGPQEYHHEIRLLITTYMIQNYSHPKLSCLLPPNEPMECYVKRSGMQVLGAWATEIEIIATPCLLQTSIYVYGQCGIGKNTHQTK